MKNPFKYRDQSDWLQAAHQREVNLSNFDSKLDAVVQVHQRVLRGYRLYDKDMEVVDAVLNQFITDMFHKRAEQVYLLEQMGVEDETDGEVGSSDESTAES